MHFEALLDLKKVAGFRFKTSSAVLPTFRSMKHKSKKYFVKRINRLVKINWWFDDMNKV